jgi:hypothetical protein
MITEPCHFYAALATDKTFVAASAENHLVFLTWVAAARQIVFPREQTVYPTLTVLVT